MSIPPINPFNLQPLNDALPLHTEKCGYLSPDFTNAELTAVSFISSNFVEAINQNSKFIVVETDSGRQSVFAEYQDKEFSDIPQRERSDLRSLIQSLWEKTRSFSEQIINTRTDEEKEYFKMYFQETERLAQEERQNGKQCEVLNIYQMSLLVDIILSLAMQHRNEISRLKNTDVNNTD